MTKYAYFTSINNIKISLDFIIDFIYDIINISFRSKIITLFHIWEWEQYSLCFITIAASSLTAASITICCISIITFFWSNSLSISSSWISQNSSWNSVKSFHDGLLGIPDDIILRISDVTNFKFKLKTTASPSGSQGWYSYSN